MTTADLRRRMEGHDSQLRIENQALEAWCRQLAIDYGDLLEELVDLRQRVERLEAFNVKQNQYNDRTRSDWKRRRVPSVFDEQQSTEPVISGERDRLLLGTLPSVVSVTHRVRL